MDVDMTDLSRICEYCIHGLEHLVPDDGDPNSQMFVNAVTEIISDMNCFDKTKLSCAVCDQKGHTFDTCLC